MDLRLQALQIDGRQRVLQVEALPDAGPGARRRAVFDGTLRIAHHRHDDHLARLLLDEGNAFLLQDGAHGVGAEGEVEAGDVAR